MALAPIQRESAVDACAHQLRQAILAGELPRGSRLPPERALAERLGVNRGTLRGPWPGCGRRARWTCGRAAARSSRTSRRPGDPTLLLGWMYLDLGLAMPRTPSFFLLERARDLDHTASP